MVDLNIWWLRPDYFPVLETLGLSYLTSGPNTLHLPEVQNLDLSFAQCGFKSLTNLDLSHFDRNMVDLNIWLKPDHFPVLKTLELSNSNIVTIPESITKFTRLQFLDLYNCKQLQEIPRLPQSIVKLNAQRCRSLDLQSSRRLLDQCGEFLGILPGSNVFFDHDRQIKIPGDKTPMWFKLNHHQSVGNSISFKVGPEIPKFGVFIAFQSMKPYRDVMCHVKVLINGEEEDESNLDDESNLYVLMESMCDHLWFICVSRGLYYESHPSGVNHIEVVCEFDDPMNHPYDILIPSDDNTDFIKWMGVHVECICCCPGSPIRKRRRVSPPMDLTYLGFTDEFDLGSSSMTKILDSTCGSSSVLDDTE
ncbi:hypothetical protein CFP56_029187 [Quercus suber]|uniref:Uncharacterized protein n=2 Tax=Quercus suber TaxID=58331 RepID=A0AAW0MC53_QUESU